MEDQAISNYRVIRKLGSGGMGDVYLAEDSRLHRRVALKLLPAEYTRNEERLWRFSQEARAVSSLNHPNILTIFEVGEADGRHFIATEFVEGENLRQQLKRLGTLSIRDALAVAEQVASALAAAHEAGVIHRDIKPENIMLRPDGYVKVLDFGLAKLTESSGVSQGESNAPTQPQMATETGVIMGTVNYMSPEQARGLKVDQRTDIWSLGCVLYEMVVGQAPFQGETVTDVLVAIVDRDLPPIVPADNSQLPVEYSGLIRKALSKQPDHRYSTMKEFRGELQSLKTRLDAEAHLGRVREKEAEKTTVIAPQTPATIPAPNRSRNFLQYRSVIWSAVLVGFLAVVIAFYWYRPRGRGEEASSIKSLAILPLKSINSGDNYLGLGIADAVIRQMNQTGLLLVRPTSAVRRYMNEEVDALTAARQLSADAVMEGTVQQSDERLRVSVNLLRTSDGRSIWADKFDLKRGDIFSIQDSLARELASSLRLKLTDVQRAGLAKRYTSNPVAYDYFTKGLASFDQRMAAGKSQLSLSIELFNQAIEADPRFALAHAQLAYAYATQAVFYETTDQGLARKAREEIARAQELDLQLAETHLARFMLDYSLYEGFDGAAAIRELRQAQLLNPNIGHAELAYVFNHLGLEDLAEIELKRAEEIDPTSDYVKGQILGMYEMGVRYDEWFAAHEKFYPKELLAVFYLIGKGRLKEAKELLADPSRMAARDNFNVPVQHALVSAIEGDFKSAEAAIPGLLMQHPVKDPFYHHLAYDIARIYALNGRSAESVKWLREASATGYRAYHLFSRDEFLARIRTSPEFLQFMAEEKNRNDKYRAEFS